MKIVGQFELTKLRDEKEWDAGGMVPRRPCDPFSCYSHLLGVLLSTSGLVALVALAHGDPWRVVAFSIYGASLILLYSGSTVYHWAALSSPRKDLLKRLDHAAIFVLIAGTYTPVCLITLRGRWGWGVGGVVWGLAAVGVSLKLSLPHLSRWMTTALYLGMGWIAVVAAAPLVRSLPIGGLIWLVTGGVVYSLGGMVYATQRPDPFPARFGFHEIFHLLVLGGSAAHFVLMVGYVRP